MNQKLIIKLFLITIVLLLPFSIYAEEKIKYTGTFSSLRYSQESGDVGGVEVRIAYTSFGHQATIQFAEGVPSKLLVANVNFNKQEVTFEITTADAFASTFKGTINNDRLKGVFHFKEGGIWKVDLPRKTSYWDE